jgi:hypothetical protein
VTAERVVDWGQIYGCVDPLSPEDESIKPEGVIWSASYLALFCISNIKYEDDFLDIQLSTLASIKVDIKVGYSKSFYAGGLLLLLLSKCSRANQAFRKEAV